MTVTLTQIAPLEKPTQPIAPIVEFSIYRYQAPLILPFTISQGRHDGADNFYCQLTDAEGRIGYGEAAPLPALTGEDPELVLQAIRDLCQSFLGLTAFDGLQSPLLSNDGRNRRKEPLPSATTAVEMALWDLWGKSEGKALYDLWSGDQTAVRFRTTDITVPILPMNQLDQFLTHITPMRFPVLKFKLGHEPTDTAVERIHHALSYVPQASYSLDGNQGLTEKQVKDLIRGLAHETRRPLFLEQPLPKDDWAGMARLTASGLIPICADETVASLEDAYKVIETQAANMINLKFMKAGIAASRAIAALTQKTGLGLMIGGMVESDVGMTASLHLACALHIPHIDLDTPFFFSDRLTSESPYHQGTAELRVPNQPGIGISLKTSLLREA